MADTTYASFRRVLAHVPTPVVVVAAFDDAPIGLAVGSFTSISLDPPLVGFFVDHRSSTWPRVARAGGFTVNVLADSQEELGRRFGTKGADRFAGVSWRAGRAGAPLLDGALAWIECELEEVIETGDHQLVMGAVRRLEARDGASPLVFHRSGFARLETEQER
ncbi:flavin reductase family protein [Conexibacter woesei]|uniref:Flavin reductase domain protein FMN-binding protein n=1 Tax=Conexibacter woesei (strain DSM 14684 / CCUG 47730 / CIP 108061 / JCM 11494 / NBRC 100937 / ID131577) TaxID=469383 RepID=D3F5A2_CONWI|nr:flavin reductase family protein [Conexibacter woesei]ADB50569.1 flavin reductase domain protein FMN-binding protein [Conexibacter woesei DSM 14684]